MDLPIVPAQLTARQGAACNRFAAQKDSRHAAMMLGGTDNLIEIAVMVALAV
ncbi:MAG: hypothetical protein ACLPXZ_28970 [Mycobacterium sp.]